MERHEVRPQARQAWETYVAAHGAMPSQRTFEKRVSGARDTARAEWRALMPHHAARPTQGEGRAEPTEMSERDALCAHVRHQDDRLAGLEARVHALVGAMEDLRAAVAALATAGAQDPAWVQSLRENPRRSEDMPGPSGVTRGAAEELLMMIRQYAGFNSALLTWAKTTFGLERFAPKQ
jgi:hypothetical protein